MPIDHCSHTFDHLAKVVLPRHFRRLRAAMKAPIAAEALVGVRSATRQVLSRLHLAADFPGCYVLLDNKKPLYVGISWRVISRLVQHLNYRSHYAASLVYRTVLA